MSTFTWKNISNCLRKYRKIRGLKQKEVAEVLGFKNTSIISRWEKGISMPNLVNLLRLSVLYRTLADALFLDLKRILKDEILKRENNIIEKT